MKTNRFSARLLPAVAASAIAALALVCAQHVMAQDSRFCSTLDRVMRDKPNDFETFKTGQYYDSTKEWDASIQLPALRTCRVDVELKNYNCYTVNLSATEANRSASDLKEIITGCLGGSPGAPRVEEDSERTRTVYVWPKKRGAEVELVLRLGKQERPRNSVFVYVQ